MTTLTVNGRLGMDCEIKYTGDGTAVTELSIVYSYGRKGEDGNRPSQWIRASMWGKQAVALVSYLNKGSGVVATLEDVHVEEYEKRDGSKGNALRGRIIKFEFSTASRNQDQSQQTQNQAARQPQPNQSNQPVRQPQQAQQSQPVQQNYQAHNYASAPLSDMDDDIPF